MKPETFLDGRVLLWCGDCLEIMEALAENSIDAVICDPPYHLQSITKRFAKTGRTDKTRTTSGPHQRTANGFMNHQWDGGDVAFRAETWAKAYRILKPGSYLIAFSSTRTFGRMQVAIEDAGFITHPFIAWIFSQGFPKAHRVTASGLTELDRATDGWEGWRYGTQSLKPAIEPIYVGQKPFEDDLTGTENIIKWGVGALNIDGCRVPCAEAAIERDGEQTAEQRYTDEGATDFAARPGKRRGRPLRIIDPKPEANGVVYSGRRVAGHGFDGGSKAVGETTLGRWPANIILDGSEEVIAAFPDAPGQQFYVWPEHGERPSRGIYGDFGARPPNEPRTDGGSAARFFYSAKADSDDRIGSKHPTVKPINLIRYLVRLVCPPNGTVLDQFAGTGTTAEAAFYEGMRAILIEREGEYQDDIRRRMKLCLGGPDERARESIKAKTKDKPIDAGPLFNR